MWVDRLSKPINSHSNLDWDEGSLRIKSSKLKTTWYFISIDIRKFFPF